MILGDFGLQTKMKPLFERIQLVDYLKSGLFPKVIDAGNVEKKIKPELFLAGPAYGFYLGKRDLQRQFTSKLGFRENMKAVLQLSENVGVGH
jgi:hypothetical protein